MKIEGGTIDTSEFEYAIIKTPDYKWEFRYHKDDNLVYMKELAPCYFHRLMQKLILGIEWRRIKK